MQIEIKGPEEVIFTDPKFKEVFDKFIQAIEAGLLVTDPVGGYDRHIRVDVWVDDWMRPTLKTLFEKAGWTVSWKYCDHVMLLI